MAKMSISEFKKRQQTRISQLKKMKRIGPVRSAMFMAATARNRAPFKSGDIRAGIRRRGGTVRSTVRNNFPHHLWVNQSVGFRTLNANKFTDFRGIPHVRMKSGNWVPVPGGAMVYGRSPKGWQWTGVAGYWDLSLMDTRQFFKRDVADMTGKVLGMRVIT